MQSHVHAFTIQTLLQTRVCAHSVRGVSQNLLWPGKESRSLPAAKYFFVSFGQSPSSIQPLLGPSYLYQVASASSVTPSSSSPSSGLMTIHTCPVTSTDMPCHRSPRGWWLPQRCCWRMLLLLLFVWEREAGAGPSAAARSIG